MVACLNQRWLEVIEKMSNLKARFIILTLIFLSISFNNVRSEEKTKLIEIDWSFKRGSQFENTLMTIDGNILTGKRVQARLRDMIIYWVVGPSKAGKVLTDDRLEELTLEWQNATGKAGSIPKVINA